ncbi:FadR/GntR family transcriptional regulator [Labrys wisconsinensis]|uniref:DNA-binding FadR family transcriptional regulator n=1 Tax=Labrys wisconsinensis TaxID=425677 RepID=A0ABU0JJK3_9HYPH|nr:FadR/GntR family transcriptional regulator [Labrys wisconsinensis]MDQ0474476.1 DNA-binding FadR family transcriptional regulator [Labrys wisconsinensis]
MTLASPFAPIERSSLAEQVARRLLDLVRTKNLRPGDQLPPERELAVLMQVSRPSLREALRGLQILGVLKARQGGGIVVSSLDASDLLAPFQMLITLNEENVNALYEARRLTEAGMARIVAEKITDEDIARLGAVLEAQRGTLADPLAFRESDAEFHRIMAAVCGNPFLVRVSQSFYILGLEYRRIAAETPGAIQQSFADHQAILAAFAAHDAEAAARAMETHMANVHRSTVAAMGGRP